MLTFLSISAVMLIWGIRKDVRGLMLPWLVLWAILCLGQVKEKYSALMFSRVDMDWKPDPICVILSLVRHNLWDFLINLHLCHLYSRDNYSCYWSSLYLTSLCLGHVRTVVDIWLLHLPGGSVRCPGGLCLDVIQHLLLVGGEEPLQKCQVVPEPWYWGASGVC